MSTTVKYKGSTLATVSNQTKKLLTSGTWLEDDIELTDVTAGGVDIPTFTVEYDQQYNPIVSCDKSFADCYALVRANARGAVVDDGGYTMAGEGYDESQTELLYRVIDYGVFVADIHYFSNGTITYVTPSTAVEQLSATSNGFYSPTYPAAYFDFVNVNVAAPAPNLQQKIEWYYPSSTSQVYNVTPDNGYDGLSSVQVNIDPTHISNLTAGNIKAGVTVEVADLTVTGTYAGGGGGVGELLNTTSLGSISTSSTTAASVANVSVSGINTYDLLIVDCSVNTETNNRHTSTVSVVFLTGSSNAATTKNGNVIATAKWNSKKNSSGTHLSYQSTTAYGIYVNSCSISSGTATLGIYRRYNSTQTGTINGTYTCRVYGVKLIDLIGG